MPIRKFAPAAYSPEQIATLTNAHKAACAALGVEQADVIYAEAIARKILEHAASDEWDPGRLCDYAVDALRARTSPA
jgi:hypothetical protein